jgi:ACS family glucarate transporter-like MFS transporter
LFSNIRKKSLSCIASLFTRTAAAAGVLNTGGNVVGFIGGMLVPFTAAKLGWVTAISSGAVFAIIGAIIWLFIHGDRPMNDDRVDN